MTTITLVGTVATVPRVSQIKDQLPVCSFRLASNERRYDRERGEWADGPTSWYTVNAFRSLATHAGGSFSKGDRVIVSGRLRIRDWEQQERSGTSAELEADALGHDLRWGTSRFTKLTGAPTASEETGHADPSAAEPGFGGGPSDRTDEEHRPEESLAPAF